MVANVSCNVSTPFDNLFAAIDRSFANVASRGPVTFEPALDWHRTDEGVVVRVATPGWAKDDLDIDIEPGRLIVSGKRPSATEGQPDETFKRALRLDNSVDTAAAEARYDNGLLTVVLPKPEAQKVRRLDIG